MNDSIKSLIKEVKKKADSQLNFNKIVPGLAGVLIEFLDGKIIEVGLEYLVEKLPVGYHSDLEVVLQAYVSGDYSQLEVQSVHRLNEAIDFPGLDEAEEEIILNGIVGAFFRIVEHRKLNS